MESKITTHISTDGTIYLRTQHGETAAEIAEALRPYIGRTMRMDLPNLYGHYHRYRGELLSVDKETVEVRVPQHDYTTVINAGDAFGTHCTTIDPIKES